MCVIPPSSIRFSGLCPPQCNHMPLPHSALSWVLSKVENLANSMLQEEATDCCFLCVTWPHAQLVSSSLALLARLVLFIYVHAYLYFCLFSILYFTFPIFSFSLYPGYSLLSLFSLYDCMGPYKTLQRSNSYKSFKKLISATLFVFLSVNFIETLM